MPQGFSSKGLWSAPTVYAADAELRYVAVCACADGMNFVSATDNLANARLIAAAPELLEALKAYVAACRHQGIRLGPITGFAEETIAKAEGRS